MILFLVLASWHGFALVQNAKQYWQYRNHQRRARSAEDLLEIINALGDATTEELRERCDEKLEEY